MCRQSDAGDGNATFLKSTSYPLKKLYADLGKTKAKRVIVPNVGAPWIVTGIKLASDQEVVFEKGVEVQAKRGAFKDSNACLFSANEKKNIRLTGPGATLRG